MGEIDVTNLGDILNRIQTQARGDNIRLTQHAQQESVEDNIVLDEVIEAISRGQILENYPQHRRGSCCLLNGFTQSGRAIHIVCTSAQPTLIIITVYEPKRPKWITPTQRRPAE